MAVKDGMYILKMLTMKYCLILFTVVLFSCEQHCEDLVIKQAVIKDALFNKEGNITSSKDHIVVINDFQTNCNSKLDVVVLESKYIDSIAHQSPLNSVTFISATQYENLHGEFDSLALTKKALISFFYQADSTIKNLRKFRNIIAWDKDAMK